MGMTMRDDTGARRKKTKKQIAKDRREDAKAAKDLAKAPYTKLRPIAPGQERYHAACPRCYRYEFRIMAIHGDGSFVCNWCGQAQSIEFIPHFDQIQVSVRNKVMNETNAAIAANLNEQVSIVKGTHAAEIMKMRAEHGLQINNMQQSIRNICEGHSLQLSRIPRWVRWIFRIL